jgi:hypothetical protein
VRLTDRWAPALGSRECNARAVVAKEAGRAAERIILGS